MTGDDRGGETFAVHKLTMLTTAFQIPASFDFVHLHLPGAIPLPLCSTALRLWAVWIACLRPHPRQSMSLDTGDQRLGFDNDAGGRADGGEVLGGKGGGDGTGDASNAPVSLTPQQQAQITALLNFKPSSRDVISGIAPHVFDDQRSSYRPRRRRRASSPDCRPHRRRSASPASHRSPLRLSAVISVDDFGAVAQPKLEENVVIELYTAPHHPPSAPSLPLPPPDDIRSTSTSQAKKPKRNSFRIDRVLKTLVLRLK
ncbi:hypothetical protein C8R43DRAFT_342093 [Mycena crocata]|nr:hypothetical protein C8R43DRAFT_342093 [Mycena crocata]